MEKKTTKTEAYLTYWPLCQHYSTVNVVLIISHNAADYLRFRTYNGARVTPPKHPGVASLWNTEQSSRDIDAGEHFLERFFARPINGSTLL
ncbi:hypothetical protein [Candidatus Synchoanobacter obligatus]|uniref:Uncharacterized protein n=1 Tax=Candidatus Synchoanobacter obligatus TaxID=2919597 RepID=A0ABT1L4K4_9GAMM|nr:hypothetical protein [Candidatus Synchoanobacter obligatus]MCP8352097.1 hypothetical protein [Candidatus Synchoanobacter obligatus]